MKTRIYKVTDELTGNLRLIEAQTPAQVLRLVAEQYCVTSATAREVASIMGEGVSLEAAPVRQRKSSTAI